MILDDDQLDELFDTRYTHTAFRLERQPAYEVPSDRLGEDMSQVSDYDRYLAGAVEPLWERKQPYLDELARDRLAMKYRYRVRILGGPDGLHPYEKYECAFGYAPNFKAGEDVFILDQGVRPVPPPVVEHDFWLLDDEVVIRMNYDQAGEYLSSELVEGQLGAYRAARDAAMAAAVPFTSWWALHPELHRVSRRVAA